MREATPSPTRDYQFVIWPDELSSDPTRVEALAYEDMIRVIAAGDGTPAPEPTPLPPALRTGQFVMIDDAIQDEQWFAQVVAPQRNLPLLGTSREHPATMTALMRILRDMVSSSAFARQAYHYELSLIGQIRGEVKPKLTTVMTRPRAGSRGRLSDVNEIIRFLGLPAIAADGANVIGRFQGVDIPVTVDQPALNMHTLVAGATGSGKTNSLANLMRAAQAMGACCLVFDFKPDYQDVDSPNDEMDSDTWSLFAPWQLAPRGLENVQYYGLAGQTQRSDGERQFAVWASDIEPEMLAAALFHSRSDENQRDLFLAILDAFRSSRTKQDGGPFSLDDVDTWMVRLVRESAEAETNGDGTNGNKKKDRKPRESAIAGALGGILNFSVKTSTLEAMNRKRRSRAPRWLDAGQRARRQDSGISALWGDDDDGAERASTRIVEFDPTQDLATGRVVVIRAPAEGREYGLFLSYILRRINRALAEKKISFPVVCFVDEAHEVFGGEKAVAEAATVSVQRAVNKGRSLGNGFVFATQNPSQLPQTILNNLNTRIIHRQNAREELKLGIPSAPEELLNSAMTLGPGEALVYIQGSRAPVTAEMAPSPFRLTKLTGQGARRLLIDQMSSEAA
ncbi:MAG: ATP-binding protein [Anaerolineales bacterium]|nr:ATP-binding protein [Anaerolineales bacterium]